MLPNIGALTHKNVGQPPEGHCRPGVPNRPCAILPTTITDSPMQQEKRKIRVDPNAEVSSVWAIPDNYEGSDGSAVILAHGAGNDMEHPFLSHFHLAVAAGLLSVKFNFPYKELGRKAPDPMPLLESTWRVVIRAVRTHPALSPKRLYLAGKSMGGRVASHVAVQGEPCQGWSFSATHCIHRSEPISCESSIGPGCPVPYYSYREPVIRCVTWSCSEPSCR